MIATEENIFLLLREVIDPELMVNIIDLGLVYKAQQNEAEKKITVEMTLTSPGCPMGEVITKDAQEVLKAHYPDFEIAINLVWEPPWSIGHLTQLGKIALGRT
ncbi:MAG: metal-sulfur cluster assembly factor [Bacteroidia bacterium]